MEMVSIKIILGSKNNSKKEAIELALNKLGISDFEIPSLEADLHVRSKPIDEETLTGEHNRNQELLRISLEKNLQMKMKR